MTKTPASAKGLSQLHKGSDTPYFCHFLVGLPGSNLPPNSIYLSTPFDGIFGFLFIAWIYYICCKGYFFGNHFKSYTGKSSVRKLCRSQNNLQTFSCVYEFEYHESSNICLVLYSCFLSMSNQNAI